MRRSHDLLRATVRPRRLRALLALAALLIACAVPAQAQEAAVETAKDPVVSVQPADKSLPPLTIQWSRLADHLSGGFAIPDASAPGGQRYVMASVSLHTILRLLGIEMTTYSAVAIPRPGDSDVLVSARSLMRQETANAGIFQDRDGSIKAVRSASTGVEGIVVPSVEDVVHFELRQSAAVTSSSDSAWVGRPLRFAATVPLEVDPAEVTYEWYFNDDAGATRTRDAVVTHSFEEPGTYNVTVTFYVDGEIVGGTIPAMTTVEIRSREEPSDGFRPEDENVGQTAGGEGNAVKDPPSDDPPADAAPDAPDVPVTSDYGDPGGDGSSGYTPPAAAAAPPPTPDPAPSTPVRRAPVRRAPQRRAAAPELPQGEQVDGYLLASATGVPVPPSAAVTPADPQLAALTSPPQDDRALHVPTPVWVALGLLLLVVLGWGLESRTTLPYFRP